MDLPVFPSSGCLVGTGFISHRHAEALQSLPGTDFQAIANPRLEAAKTLGINQNFVFHHAIKRAMTARLAAKDIRASRLGAGNE